MSIATDYVDQQCEQRAPVLPPMRIEEQFDLFPLDALPSSIASFASEAAASACVDPSFIAVPALAAMAGAIGNTHRIVLLEEGSWTEPAVLWTVIVGESGTMKSPAIAHAVEPIHGRQRDAIFRHKEANRTFLETPKEERGASPVCERFVVSDITIEALADRMENAPRGLLLVRDEIDGWLGGFNQYKGGKGGDTSHWLTMHGARPLMFDRKTGDRKTVYVPHAALSITGSIQPGTLTKALGEEHFENGLAARFMFTMPPRRAKVWEEMRPIPPGVKAAYAGVIGGLLDLPMGEHPTSLRLSPEAKRIWGEFVNEHAQEQLSIYGDLAKAWSKLEGGAARIAMVLHLARSVEGDLAFGDPGIVDERSMRDGIRLCRWFAGETRRVYKRIKENEAEREDRQRIDLLKRHESVTARDWYKIRGITVDEAEAQLRAMVEAGIAEEFDAPAGPQGGRPTKRVRLRG